MPPRVYPDLLAYFRENPDEGLLGVSRDVGCSMAHLCMIKYSTRQPTLPLALRIARRCRVPLESMVQDKRELLGV